MRLTEEPARRSSGAPEPLIGVAPRDRNRFVPPRAAVATIARARLDHLYDDARGGVLRVLAPGGYGKSTQVARWVAHDHRRVAWVDLEAIDNDPSVLAETLTRALGLADVTAELGLRGISTSRRDFVERIVPVFADAIATDDEPFVLVLDDVHTLTDHASAALVDSVAENLDTDSTLVLVGRAHRTDERVGRLRVEPGVIDVLSDQLALETAEADELLTSFGIDIEPGQRAAIIERFAGWPTGLRLAGLVLKTGRSITSSEIEDLGDATFVADYLRSEWTASLGPDDLDLLHGAACLGRFTGELCDAILGRSGSASVLRTLQRDEQLILPLDERDHWYRMHPVLSRWLETELRSQDPAGWRGVHHAASNWWEDAGDIDLAFHHATRISDHGRQEQLILRHAPHHFTIGRYETVQRWLETLPDSCIESSIELCALAAMHAIQAGDADRVGPWYVRMQRCAAATGDGNGAPGRHAQIVQAIVESGPPAVLGDIARIAADDLTPSAWRTTGLWVAGCHLFMAGNEDALGILRQASATAPVDAGPQLQANCLATEALVADPRGDHSASADAARRAVALVRAIRSDFLPSTAIVTALSALVDARSGKRDEAMGWLATSRRQQMTFASMVPWFNVFVRLPLIRTAIVLRDHRLASDLLHETAAWLARYGEATGAERHLEQLRAEVDALTADAASVERLTPAELRVLAYLPTHLSLADIAQRLFVSRNTVKTHAAAIYRKFGTTSRSEAVAIAQASGLLDDHEPTGLDG